MRHISGDGVCSGGRDHPESPRALALPGDSPGPLSSTALVFWPSQARFDEVVSLMAHQWEQVRSQILGLTIQVKPKFAKQKKTGLIDT